MGEESEATRSGKLWKRGDGQKLGRKTIRMLVEVDGESTMMKRRLRNYGIYPYISFL